MKLIIRLTALALFLAALGGAFAACRRDGGVNTDGTDTQGGKETVTLTVWGAQEDQQMLKEMCEAYAKENSDKVYTFNFGVLGEGNSSDKILGDVEAGPDVFSFPSDRLNTFYAAGALARIGGAIETAVKSENAPGAVDAATITVNGEEHLYAFPVTGDNCYFVYYDKSVFTDPVDLQSLDRMLDVAEAAGKKSAFQDQRRRLVPGLLLLRGRGPGLRRDL